jgi:hypothetical protein
MKPMLYKKSLLIMLTLLACSRYSLPQSARKDDSKASIISVKISAERARIRLGEDVRLRVEIQNDGIDQIFIQKSISIFPSNLLATLDLTLYDGSHVEKPSFQIAADSFSGERSDHPALIGELTKYWIALPPHHFYGGEVVIPVALFEKWHKRGKYHIRGKYKSRGFLAGDINNPLLSYAKELRELPYQAWVGEVETNSIWIEVTN